MQFTVEPVSQSYAAVAKSEQFQTAGRNKSFQSLAQLHFGQWSSLPFCLPSLIVQKCSLLATAHDCETALYARGHWCPIKHHNAIWDSARQVQSLEAYLEVPTLVPEVFSLLEAPNERWGEAVRAF